MYFEEKKIKSQSFQIQCGENNFCEAIIVFTAGK